MKNKFNEVQNIKVYILRKIEPHQLCCKVLLKKDKAIMSVRQEIVSFRK